MGVFLMIAIGCDHAGCEMKQAIIDALSEKGFEFKDMGVNVGEKCDYPDMAEAVCNEVTSGRCDKGILICGTGIGMSIAANKIKGIRAALCSDCFSAKYTRLHNDSNVMCMGARTLGHGLAVELSEIFLSTGFEGGRHQRRIDLITKLENKND
jgi:ribose 5-phosphate isomerase B